MSKPVFISYSTDDTTVTEQIRDSLETAGMVCWMAPRDIAPGLDYGTQIIDAIEICTVLLLVLCESSNYSIYVRKEVERAIAKGKVVVLFRIQEIPVSRCLEFFISDAQWIDGWGTQMGAATTIWHVLVRGHLGSRAERGERSPAVDGETGDDSGFQPSARRLPTPWQMQACTSLSQRALKTNYNRIRSKPSKHKVRPPPPSAQI